MSNETSAEASYVESKSARQSVRDILSAVLAVWLSLFVLIEVNFSLLNPLQEMSLFATTGLMLAFLQFPLSKRFHDTLPVQIIDAALVALSVLCCLYLVYQGPTLGQRAALYTTTDLTIGAVGLVLVMEATRRTTGWAVPILALLFFVYAHESIAQQLPDWAFPHRGQDWQSLIGQLYLRTEGVFGTALGVMFRYVFLFVLFGALLEASGATQYIIQVALRLLGKRSGGPAKVAVVASGLMGSLSGSAVANAATTGVFTIPLMKSIGFRPHIAAGVEAAASSGGALAPPVMGAGAYMMLEIINRQPPVTYVEVMKAALIPAILYYFSLYLLVHFHACRNSAALTTLAQDKQSKQSNSKTVDPPTDIPTTGQPLPVFGLEGFTFVVSLLLLMGLLLTGISPFRSVSYAMVFLLGMILINPRTPTSLPSRLVGFALFCGLTVVAKYFVPNVERWQDAVIWGMAGVMLVAVVSRPWRKFIMDVLHSTAKGSVSLIVVAACVGIVIGLVSRTGIGTGVPQAIIPLAGDNLFLGLVAIMVCSLILGMGLPSAVSYLLLATIIGPVFADPAVGVPILAAHMFIFYFGMMAMVTPPVALAGYATASIAGAGVMQSSFAGFRFALVGFTLPFMFVYRPALCLIGDDGGAPYWLDVVVAVVAAVIGIYALAAAMGGYLFHPLKAWQRGVLFAAAACALFPDRFNLLGNDYLQLFDVLGAILLAIIGTISFRQSRLEG
jgi:TRAP transporter 4TM/12TM fusion protein